jgi:outer membrane scaffolding protein for murein synthesis (MipA/OmpV family)
MDPGASAGFHLEWDGKLGAAPVNLLGRLRHYLDSDRGSQFDLRGTAGVYQGGGATAGVFTQLTFASAENTFAYYGVRDSGLLYASLGALGSYDFTKQWIGVWGVEARRLSSGIAGASTVVQRRTGAYASAGVAYKF